MGKYWLSREDRITGPFDPDELMRLPGISMNSVVCPEDLLGTADERWARAGNVPELAETVPPVAPADASGTPAPSPSSDEIPGPWPPDPSRRDVDPLETAAERIDVLDKRLGDTQRRLDARREAYKKLKEELEERLHTTNELETQMKEMAARMGGFLGMRREMDRAQAALAMQNERIERLRLRMEAQKALDAAPAEEDPAEPDPGP